MFRHHSSALLAFRKGIQQWFWSLAHARFWKTVQRPIGWIMSCDAILMLYNFVCSVALHWTTLYRMTLKAHTRRLRFLPLINPLFSLSKKNCLANFVCSLSNPPNKYVPTSTNAVLFPGRVAMQRKLTKARRFCAFSEKSTYLVVTLFKANDRNINTIASLHFTMTS